MYEINKLNFKLSLCRHYISANKCPTIVKYQIIKNLDYYIQHTLFIFKFY